VGRAQVHELLFQLAQAIFSGLGWRSAHDHASDIGFVGRRCAARPRRADDPQRRRACRMLRSCPQDAPGPIGNRGGRDCNGINAE
jgi:hypothetical protein